MAQYVLLAGDDPHDDNPAGSQQNRQGFGGHERPATPRDLLRSFNPLLIGFGMLGLSSRAGVDSAFLLTSTNLSVGQHQSEEEV